MNKREKRTCDLAAWLWRNRKAFPDGFTAEAIEQRATWELARYFGTVRLKTPEERMVVQMPEKDRTALRMLGIHDFAKVTVYQKQISPRRIGWDHPDFVPRAFTGNRSSVARILSVLERAGSIVAVPGSKPRRYVFERAALQALAEAGGS